jgi:hypothetical protein
LWIFLATASYAKKMMRWYISSIIVASTTIAAVFYYSIKNKHAVQLQVVKSPPTTTDENIVRIQQYSKQLAAFAKLHGYNTNYCFLVDMKIPSGKNRFFVYDIKGDSVAKAGMVTHGSGNAYSSEIIFSNKPGSNCSSIGKYKIGQSYNGKFGLAYKLHGLDTTNSNAYNRFVVLHAHPSVPMHEVDPQKICTSWGCPTVSPFFLEQLKFYLNKPGKPILLWIYN